MPSLWFATGKLASLFSSRRCALVVVKSISADLEKLGGWMTAGMEVPIEATYPVRDAAAALTEFQRGGRMGKIAIEVAGGW